MADSFWEKVGRSVGDGLQKAKDAAASIGEKGEAILDKQELRRRIRRSREELSRVVEKELRGADGPPYQLENPGVKELLEEIRQAEEEIEKLEKAGKKEPGNKEGDAGVARDAQVEESGSVAPPDPDI